MGSAVWSSLSDFCRALALSASRRCRGVDPKPSDRHILLAASCTLSRRSDGIDCRIRPACGLAAMARNLCAGDRSAGRHCARRGAACGVCGGRRAGDSFDRHAQTSVLGLGDLQITRFAGSTSSTVPCAGPGTSFVRECSGQVSRGLAAGVAVLVSSGVTRLRASPKCAARAEKAADRVTPDLRSTPSTRREDNIESSRWKTSHRRGRPFFGNGEKDDVKGLRSCTPSGS